MASILEDIKKEKSIVYAKIQIKIPVDLKDKLGFIAEHSGVPTAEYVAKLLENSEINKVYSSLKSSLKNEKKEQNESKESTQKNNNIDSKESLNGTNEAQITQNSSSISGGKY